MASFMRMIFVCTVLCLASLLDGAAAKKMLRDIGNTTRSEVEAELASELAGHIPEERIKTLEDALRPMYTSLPKNNLGNLGHQAVRYALHRFFESRHQWYIKGLEPTSSASSLSKSDWVPSFIQNRLEQHLGNTGMDLHELASLAAVLEDLVRQESDKRLKVIYEVLKFPMDKPITHQQAMDALNTYTMVHLLGGKKNISISSPENTAKKRKIFQAKYRNYSDFEAWFDKLLAREDGIAGDGPVKFSAVLRAVEHFGEEYGRFNDLECRALRKALIEHEGHGRGAGRVRLADFYNMSRHSHWKLHEKAEYLKDLGALDDTNASNPLLIVANYVASRPNCLEATPLYSVCCRDECEDIIGNLERQIAAPKASPMRIAQVVAATSSNTVTAPRTISGSLLNRLDDIAKLHFGEVDMHSRLFAQWMHHAFPRECPYPHEAGTLNPVSAEEWMQTNGHESQLASEDEVQHVLNSACSISEDGELPWSHVEERLDYYDPEPPSGALYGLIMLTISLWALLALYIGRFRKTLASQKLRTMGMLLGVVVLISAAVLFNLVDMEVVGCIMVIGLVIDFIRYVGVKMTGRSSTLPKVL